MPDPFAPIVLCREPDCQRELTRAERHDSADHDGLCDACWALHLESFALPVPPRMPRLEPDARLVLFPVPERVPCAEPFDPAAATVRPTRAA